MGALKWIILIALLFTPLSPLVVIYFGITFLASVIKMAIMVDVLTIYLILSLIFQWPLYLLFRALGFGAHKIENAAKFFYGGVMVYEEKPKLMIPFTLLSFVMVLSMMPVDLTDLLAPANIASNSSVIIMSFAFPTIALLFFSAIYKYKQVGGIPSGHSSSGGQHKLDPAPGSTAAQAGQALGNQAQNVNHAAHRGHEVEEAAHKAKKSKGLFPDNMKKAGLKLKSAIPMMGGSKKKKAKTAAKAGKRGVAAGAAAVTAGAATGPAAAGVAASIIIPLVLAAIFIVVQFIVVMIFFIGYLQMFLPMVAGPFLSAFGLAEAYGDWLGTSVGDQYGPQFEGMFSEVELMTAPVFAQAKCALQGPECLREWRLNNTVRPGSDAVGERYELRIDEFNMGVDQIDTAFKTKEFSLPVNFLVSNTRHGLKGIEAENVKYNIRVRDADGTICQLGDRDDEDRIIFDEWYDLETETGDTEESVILPGLGVTPTDDLQELNLMNCEMLQPSAGINRNIVLEIKYEYSSQATLDFQAMSREHRRELGTTPGFKKSETADTPVQSYINVHEPVTFFETQTGQRNPVRFDARFGFETPGFDVRYQIDPESVQIFGSNMVTATENCPDINEVNDFNPDNPEYELSDRAINRINNRQNAGEWFDASTSPAPLRCTMELSDPDRISETGEQLLMRIDADYTIIRDQMMESFSIWNTGCERNNCPLLATHEYIQESDEFTFNSDQGNKIWSECTTDHTIDSRDGCSIREPVNGEIQWNTFNLYENDDGSPVIIEEGKEARRADYLENELSEERLNISSSNRYINDDVYGNFDVVGVSTRQLRELGHINRGLVATSEPNQDPQNLNFEETPGAMCEIQSSTDLGDYRDKFLDMTNYEEDDIVMFAAQEVDCTRSIAQHLLDTRGCLADAFVNSASFTYDVATFDLSGAWDTFTSPASDDCLTDTELEQRCTDNDGILIETFRGSNAADCYGASF